MLEVLVRNKKGKYDIDLNSDKNYSCWVLKEIKKDKNPPPKLLDNKNIISYGAMSLYLQKINTKKNTTSKYYEIKLSNLSEDIFPFERNPDINFIYYNSNKENLFGNNNYEKKMSNADKFEEYKQKIINMDIPEMILYKYKYDEKIFQEISDDSEDEINYIYKIIQTKNKIINIPNDEVINCIESIINIHKKQFFDIPYIIQKKSSIYNQLFTEDEVVAILSLYDAAYIQFKLKQKKITKLFNQTLIMTNNQYKFNYDYINNVENELDLELALSYIGFLITIFNNDSKNKFCNSLMDLNINLNSKKLLQSILEDECDKITEQFCLSPEEVVYNLKLLKKEIPPSKLKEPNNECQLMDLCLNKVNELSKKNKKYHPIHLLQKAINYHIISLSSHPYIAKLIYETYIKIVTISTTPTEKGKIILNSSHPSFRCKRIEKCPVEKLITAMRNNENNFSEIYLDIEKCENEGLINVKYEIDLTSKDIEELISLLNKAINGYYEEKKEFNINNNSNKKNSDNMSESDDNESSKTKLDYKKNILARKIVVKNMILDKEFTQKFFINHIKKKLHNIAEKSLIEKISKNFYSLITRQYIKNTFVKNDDDNYYYSMFFLNSNEFCCISIDKNKKLKYHNIFRAFFNENENNLEQNKKLSEINELRREFLKHRPKYIIIGINNIGCFQLIEYLKEYYNDILIYSDYLSLLKKPKNYDNIFNDDESYYYNVALDQYKFTINPLYFFIENYNFKYEKNLILNIKLDPLQDQIIDITLLNYCLETQIKRVINLFKFKFPKEKNTPENYFCFMNGLGPVTGRIMEDNKNIKSIEEMKIFLKKNISKNFEEYLADENDMEIDNENNINSHIYLYSLNEEDIFNKMTNAFNPLKENTIHNVMVNNIDSTNNIVNCVLFYNENILNCVLPFDLIPDFVVNKEVYFKKYRIILCKIIEIKIKDNEYTIKISNKIQDLEYYNKLSFVEEESYLKKEITGFQIKEEEDYKLNEIEKLKNIINMHKEKTNKSLVKIKEDRYKRNTYLDEIKKEILPIDDYGHFCIRPSFIGSNHLFLTFSIIEDLTLNYDIIKDNNKEYILNDKKYQNIDEIIKDFANQLLKKINEFKNNKFFKTPSQMKSILDIIFKNINNKTNYYEKNIFKDNIIICFMEDSPNYGLLLSKTINYNYTIDYIEILSNGFHFHNLFFENIYLVIDYYYENHEKEYYKEFICNQHIYNIHSQIEDIDIYYDHFTEIEKNEKIEWSLNPQEQIFEKNQFLGKKLNSNEFSGWNDEKVNNENNKNENVPIEWGDSFSPWDNNNANNDNEIFNNKQNDKNKSDNIGNNNSNKFDSWYTFGNNNNSNSNNNIKSWDTNNNNDNSDSWNNNNKKNNWNNNTNNNNHSWNGNKKNNKSDSWNNNKNSNKDNWNNNKNNNIDSWNSNTNDNKNNNIDSWNSNINDNKNNNIDSWNSNTNDNKNNNIDGWNSNTNNNKINNIDSWNNNTNNNKSNNIDSWNTNNNNNNFNSWDNNNKKESDNIWGNNDNIQNNNNNNFDTWADINNDNKTHNYKKKNEKDFNENNDTNIISSEKISNNYNQYKKEENVWNSSNNNYNKHKYKDNSQDKYNNKKSNYKNNNKEIRDKNKKRKYNESNNVASNFSGWGTDENIIEEEENNIEEKKEEEYNSNINNINTEDVWDTNNNRNEWDDAKNKENETDTWGNFGEKIDNSNNSNNKKNSDVWVKPSNNQDCNNNSNNNNWGITENNNSNNNNWGISESNNSNNDWNKGIDKNDNKKKDNEINWDNNNINNNNQKDEINWGSNNNQNNNWSNKSNDVWGNNSNDNWNNNSNNIWGSTDNDNNKNNSINNNNKDWKKRNDNKFNNKFNNTNTEKIYNCSNNKYYQNSFNNNYQNKNNNNNNNFHNNRGKNNNNAKKKKKGNQWKDELYKNDGINDIKDENDGDIIEFENVDEFGGFNLEKNNEDDKK